jgi:hypothetical protein
VGSKFTGTGTPELDDPNWRALPAHASGHHVEVRGSDNL